MKQARDFARSQKDQEIAIDSRIKFLQNQDHKLRHSIEKARQLGSKKKAINDSRQMHEMLIQKNYQRKVTDIKHQMDTVAARREEGRQNNGTKASYILNRKQDDAKIQQIKAKRNMELIWQEKEISVVYNQRCAKAVKISEERQQAQKDALQAQQLSVNRIYKQQKFQAVQEEIKERAKSINRAERLEMQAIEKHKQTINLHRREMKKIEEETERTELIPGMVKKSLEKDSILAAAAKGGLKSHAQFVRNGRNQRSMLGTNSATYENPPNKRKSVKSIKQFAVVDFDDGLSGWGNQSTGNDRNSPLTFASNPKPSFKTKLDSPAYYDRQEGYFVEPSRRREQNSYPFMSAQKQEQSLNVDFVEKLRTSESQDQVFSLTQTPSGNKLAKKRQKQHATSEKRSVSELRSNKINRQFLKKQFTRFFEKPVAAPQPLLSLENLANRSTLTNKLPQVYTLSSPTMGSGNPDQTTDTGSLLPGLSTKSLKTSNNQRTSGSFNSRQKRYQVWQGEFATVQQAAHQDAAELQMI